MYINISEIHPAEKTLATAMTYVRPAPMEGDEWEEGMFASFDNSIWGALVRAADRLVSARPKERPASATNRDSRRSVGVATAARCMRDGVTGSACTDRLHPSGHLACECLRCRTQVEKGDSPYHPAAALEESMAGRKYGRMTILEELPRRYSHRIVLCVCDCGTKKPARLDDLKRGQTVSCGCWKTNPRPRKAKE